MVYLPITFFSSLLVAALSALIGVFIQSWYSKRKLRKQIREALKEEVKINIKRLEDVINSLKNEKNGVPPAYLTKCYETLLTQDPEFHNLLTLKTNSQIDEAYQALHTYNSLHTLVIFAMAFSESETRDSEETELESVKKKLEHVLEVLEKL